MEPITLSQQHVDEQFVEIVARLTDLHRAAETIIAMHDVDNVG
jgi:hypothetical protein